MWTTARLTTYLTGAVGLVGLLLASLGWAEFDIATGMIDPAPFNAYALVGAVPALLAPIIATVAVLFRWGPSK